jgi:hypothetical protein
VPGQGGGGGKGQRRQISPQLAENHKIDDGNGRFLTLFGLKIPENAVFRSKLLHKIYSQDVFEE